MGRRKGGKNKSTLEMKDETKVEANENETKEKAQEATRSTVLEKPAVLVEPLQPGQKYFETPDGELIIGEDSKQQVWCRRLNNGHGGWVNPKR